MSKVLAIWASKVMSKVLATWSPNVMSRSFTTCMIRKWPRLNHFHFEDVFPDWQRATYAQWILYSTLIWLHPHSLSPSPPLVPRVGSVLASVQGPGSVEVTWTLAYSGGLPVLHFELHFQKLNDTVWQSAGRNCNSVPRYPSFNTTLDMEPGSLAVAHSRSWIVNGLESEELYIFRVRAANELGEGEYAVTEPLLSHTVGESQHGYDACRLYQSYYSESPCSRCAKPADATHHHCLGRTVCSDQHHHTKDRLQH